MSAYFEALRAQLEPALVCPKCHEVNLPKASPTVTLVDRDTASCSQCSHAGPLHTFQLDTIRPQEKP